MKKNKHFSVSLPQARLLNRSQAASYCGLSLGSFNAGVLSGKFPRPIRITERQFRWDVNQLDLVIDKMSELTDGSKTDQQWLKLLDGNNEN